MNPSNGTPQRPPIRLIVAIVISVIVLIGVAAVIVWSTVRHQDNSSSTVDADTPAANDQPAPQPSTPDPDPAPPSATGTVITTGSSEFGTMLFNDKQQAIYIWEVEKTTTPECYDDCAVAWPPVLTDGAPQAAGDVNAGLLGTAKRTDGTTQVTYNGHPLYYYAHEGPGEVKCHNISTHGGLWWVVQPDGNRAA